MANIPKTPKNLLTVQQLSDDYILITPENRKHCVILGRLIHVIQRNSANHFDIKAYFDIRVRLEIGWMRMSTFAGKKDYEVYVFNDEDPISYKEQFSSLLNDGITRGIYYIKKDQRLVTYTKIKNKTEKL